ncbi:MULTISPECIES: hypothetical protein [unclassified Sphingomonas]|uniref:hypothetical protein n=1 Tax=unclassified Sphingomonas TaxID=196159 RepID=UPI00215179BB|nr:MULTISPECIES: hypothetical protein [unclassified Sphingomonas]MCR5871943.1 hypothetical protein [Sphingomonas sp. J344]UUX99779.1 hypothetical protein LRS08_01010 [Sphingomonas sp. J315]
MALWIALLVALASSLLSSGLPRTIAYGSAFNPATTSVALKPIRPASRIMAETPRRDDGPAAGASDLATPALATAPIPPIKTDRAPIVTVLATLSLHPHPVLDGSPRGPPQV